jgi:hypothetical protein
VEAVEGEGATNLGRERAEEAIPRWTEARRRKWRGDGNGAREQGLGILFIGKRDGGGRPGRAESRL